MLCLVTSDNQDSLGNSKRGHSLEEWWKTQCERAIRPHFFKKQTLLSQGLVAHCTLRLEAISRLLFEGGNAMHWCKANENTCDATCWREYPHLCLFYTTMTLFMTSASAKKESSAGQDEEYLRIMSIFQCTSSLPRSQSNESQGQP